MTEFTPKQYAEHLAQSGKRIHPEVSKILNVAVRNVRDDWRRMAAQKNRTHAPGYPRSITATWAKVVDGVMVASVEPKTGKTAKLGTILEYGGPRNAPQLSNLEAAAREIPTMLKHLRKAAEDAAK